jgi:hypothetical protein
MIHGGSTPMAELRRPATQTSHACSPILESGIYSDPHVLDDKFTGFFIQ